MNASSTRAPLSHGVSTIRAPNRKNGIAWKIALTFSPNCPNASGRRARQPPADAGQERRDQAVAPGHVGEPVGEQRQAERVDALVVVGDAAPGEAAQDQPGGVRDARARSRAPTATSPISSAPAVECVAPGAASTRKNRTNGRASPSLSPDSRLSVCRMMPGTRRAVTTVDVTTGSVGASTAPSRKHSAQSSVREERPWRERDQAMVTGIAMISARRRPPVRSSSSRSTNSPSENRVRISASSIACRDGVGPAVDRHGVDRGQPTPAADGEDRRVQDAAAEQPDSAAAAATRAPRTSRDSEKSRLIAGGLHLGGWACVTTVTRVVASQLPLVSNSTPR